MPQERERNEAVYRQLGRRIRACRKKLAMTQSDLAKQIAVARASVANIELGKQRVSIELLFAIGKVLKTEPRDLLPCMSELLSPAPPIPNEVLAENPELADWLQRVTTRASERRMDATEIPEETARPNKGTRRAQASKRKKSSRTG